MELIALLVLAAGTGSVWLLRRLGKKKAASDVDFIREILQRLGTAYAARGREAAVDQVMAWLTGERLVRAAGLLGIPRTAGNDYRVRVVRVWLQKKLDHLVKKLEG